MRPLLTSGQRDRVPLLHQFDSCMRTHVPESESQIQGLAHLIRSSSPLIASASQPISLSSFSHCSHSFPASAFHTTVPSHFFRRSVLLVYLESAASPVYDVIPRIMRIVAIVDTHIMTGMKKCAKDGNRRYFWARYPASQVTRSEGADDAVHADDGSASVAGQV